MNYSLTVTYTATMKAERSTNTVSDEFKKDDANCENVSKNVTTKVCGDNKIRTTKTTVNDGSGNIHTTIIVEEYKAEDTSFDKVMSTEASFTVGDAPAGLGDQPGTLASEEYKNEAEEYKNEEDNDEDTGYDLTAGKRYTFAPLNDKIYWYIGDELLHIPDPETQNNIFNPGYRNKTFTIDEARDASIGTPLQSGALLVQRNEGGKVYLISNQERRWVTDGDTFAQCEFNLANVQRADQFIIESIHEGDNITTH